MACQAHPAEGHQQGYAGHGRGHDHRQIYQRVGQLLSGIAEASADIGYGSSHDHNDQSGNA